MSTLVFKNTHLDSALERLFIRGFAISVIPQALNALGRSRGIIPADNKTSPSQGSVHRHIHKRKICPQVPYVILSLPREEDLQAIYNGPRELEHVSEKPPYHDVRWRKRQENPEPEPLLPPPEPVRLSATNLQKIGSHVCCWRTKEKGKFGLHICGRTIQPGQRFPYCAEHWRTWIRVAPRITHRPVNIPEEVKGSLLEVYA